MNLGGGLVGSMNLTSSTVNRKSADDNFPVGLRVLVVDDDPTCLTILEMMLRTCRYEGNLFCTFFATSINYWVEFELIQLLFLLFFCNFYFFVN